MDLTGNISDIKTNYITGKFELTVTVNEPDELTRGYEELKGFSLLDVRIRKHRQKRSLDANAYFHVLVDKLADRLRISKPRCKNLMIGRYGQPFYVDESETQEAVIKTNIPVSAMMENETVHCLPCGCRTENEQEVTFYRIMRGSSTYDTREMTILIDGVVDECREQGIETIPPDELERMLGRWKA